MNVVNIRKELYESNNQKKQQKKKKQTWVFEKKSYEKWKSHAGEKASKRKKNSFCLDIETFT